MSTTQVEQDRTHALVIDWRRHELRRAGYDPKQASQLAPRFDVDLHRAVDLVRHGCAPTLAMRILL
jgi:hypothetical protein